MNIRVLLETNDVTLPPALEDDIRSWQLDYSKDDAYTHDTDRHRWQQELVTFMAGKTPPRITVPFLYRSTAVDDALMAAILRGETVVIPKSTSVLESWGKSAGQAMNYLEPDGPMCGVMMALPPSALSVVFDIDTLERPDETGEVLVKVADRVVTPDMLRVAYDAGWTDEEQDLNPKWYVRRGGAWVRSRRPT